jgi:3-oxoacyl-[acyl-carrier-protein] synthase-3
VKAAILGTGYYVPSKIVTNDDLSQTLDTSDEWIYSHTGIKSRRIAAEDEAASDLGTHAAKSALQNAGIDPNEVDMILVATTSPDYNSFPSTASIIQDKIGASKAGAMDLSAACTGFVYAMETARAFIEAGSSRYILVIGTEVFSRILNWEDRNTCILFGDAAGAVVVGPSKSDQTPILLKAILTLRRKRSRGPLPACGGHQGPNPFGDHLILRPPWSTWMAARSTILPSRSSRT